MTQEGRLGYDAYKMQQIPRGRLRRYELDPGVLDRLTRESLHERVVHAIRDAIVQGRLRPGQKIPEHDLADQLGVSRTPIREALRVLEQQDLVETRPKRGTFVRRVDYRDVRDGLSVRMALEEVAIRQVLERVDGSDWDRFVDKAGQIVDAMRVAVEEDDPVSGVELDVEFHTMLIDAADNRYLSNTWRLVGLPTLVWAPEREIYPQAAEDLIVGFPRRHQELLDALRTRDPQVASRAVRDHIALKIVDLDRARSTQEPGVIDAGG
ncbi:MAG: GntR family transcriptional regulator [Nitriliruptorales bacterium]